MSLLEVVSIAPSPPMPPGHLRGSEDQLGMTNGAGQAGPPPPPPSRLFPRKITFYIGGSPQKKKKKIIIIIKRDNQYAAAAVGRALRALLLRLSH